jgi:hydrogenase expression/formation protein HypE
MADTRKDKFILSCPAPAGPGDRVQLAHGGGGRWMKRLLDEIVLPHFANPALNQQHDGAVVPFGGGRLAFTTDSYVVHPLFFPGGDIGALAVNGTVNDLAMCGARPLHLSAGLILEEGLEFDLLRRVLASMRAAVQAAGVTLVTGDTKVVDHGKGDQLFINTAGIGVVETRLSIRPSSVRPGDAVLVSGDLGRHGVAILSVREGLEFGGAIESDCAPLWGPVEALLDQGIEIHCLRDLTRGGLSSALNEIAATRLLGVRLRETAVPVDETVQGACELLGLDPLYVANEGRFAAFLPAAQAERAAGILRRHPGGARAAVVGQVVESHPGTVIVETAAGASRVLDMLSGEQLPRIC